MTSQNNSRIDRIDIPRGKEQAKEVIFVDARSATSLKRNPTQVPGAIHVPVKKLDRRLKLLPRDRTLVTYCT
jgi:rhodanese-related sulfurtransferase